MNRNLSNIIQQMIDEIPFDEQDFINNLKDNQSSVSCVAPELISMWWNEIHETLWNFIPEKPNKEWQFKILSIFSTKTVEELKEILL